MAIKSLIVSAVLMGCATMTYAEINSCYYREFSVNYSNNKNKFIVPAGTVLDMNEALKDIYLEKRAQQSDTLMTYDGHVIYPAKLDAGINIGANKKNPAVHITAIHYDTDSQQGYFQVYKGDKSGVITQQGELSPLFMMK